MIQATTIQQCDHDDGYDRFAIELRRNFRRLPAGEKLFTTDAEGLFDTFLGALPLTSRQHYTCRACRSFVERFGGLVTIDAEGRTKSAIWSPADQPPMFCQPVFELARVVNRAKVTGAFLSSEPTWGTPENVSGKGVRWGHMHVVPLPETLYRRTILTADQAMAAKREEYVMLQRGLADYSIDQVREAHRLLTTGGLYRSEKCEGVAKWLLDLHEAILNAKGSRSNLVWRAVASAPAGFAHVRSGMIGTLLDDIASGLPFADIKARFDAKMDPLHYLRPQAAPSDGQLAAAEKIIATLASAGALERRYARLEEVLPYAIWTPKVAEAPAGPSSVFGHLKATKSTPLDIDGPTMTWTVFARDILPTADRIEVEMPMRSAPFFGFMTATNPNAPPILQWDREDTRQPVSWYFRHGGSTPPAFALNYGAWVDVTAITPPPCQWAGRLTHHSDGIYLVLHGAKDIGGPASLCLFPETLRSEYHGIRASIEAFSASREPSGRKEATACGLAISKGQHPPTRLRVTSKGARTTVTVDRLE